MKRRDYLKLLTGGIMGASLAPAGVAAATVSRHRKRVLRVAHITDVHIDTGNNAMERFAACLELVKKEKPDLILNGGDSVMAVDYNDITKDRVTTLWDCWHTGIQSISNIPMHSALGNHDMWWQGKGDPMYGKPGALQMLQLDNAYYSINYKDWHFVVLDSNHAVTPGMLDDEQFDWLTDDLAQHRDKHTLILSHYPILTVTGIVDNKPDKLGPFTTNGGYMHLDAVKLSYLFLENPQVKLCLSGHIHLLDQVYYNGVHYICNAAVSGYWWGKGDDGKGAYKQTPPGFAILDLYDDGGFENRHIRYETPGRPVIAFSS